MRPKKIDNEALLKGLTSVIRTKGYDGSSLNELAAASGLQKASLYHRFPGGKEEITRTVLTNIHEWIDANILSIIADSSRTIEDRLSIALENTSEFYQDGEAVCIIRALSLGSGLSLFGNELNASIESWLQAFTQLGIDAGFELASAKDLATETFILIQGSLVLSNGSGSPIPFKNTLFKIRNMYLK